MTPPLDPDAIAREFRRIYPVTPTARHRYYPVGEESRFSWQAECNVTEPTQGSLEWSVEDAAGQTVVPLQREEVKLTPGSYGRDFEAAFVPKQAGRHTLVCRWKPAKGGTPYERRLDVWAIGNRRGLSGDKDLDLDLVEKIDCASDLPETKLVQTAPTKVVHAECGAYREAGEGRNDRFAIRIKLPETDCPYVVEWDYPDDKPRTMEMISQSVEARHNEYELQTGVFTGGEYPLSHKMKTFALPLLAAINRNGPRFHDGGEGAACRGGRSSRLPSARQYPAGSEAVSFAKIEGGPAPYRRLLRRSGDLLRFRRQSREHARL